MTIVRCEGVPTAAVSPVGATTQSVRAVVAGLCAGAAMWGVWYLMVGPHRMALTGADLGAANLAGLNFPGADLHATNFANGNLDGAVLRGDCFAAANLASAHLESADLRTADLRSANLAEADLRGSDLSGADFRNANLAGSRLTGCTVCGTDFRSANLSTADLRGAKYDAATRWPDGLSLPSLGARFSPSTHAAPTPQAKLAEPPPRFPARGRQ